MTTTNKQFDLNSGDAVTVVFDGQELPGTVVGGHFNTRSNANYIAVSYQAGPTRYEQSYSRKTGKQFGGSLNPKIRASYLKPAEAARPFDRKGDDAN